ncbi:MAG: aminopeptidase [Phycisphaerales bacterium]
MRDPRLDRLADVIVRYSTRVKRGDTVEIRAVPVAMPLITAVYEAVLKAGGHPFFMARPEELEEAMVRFGSDEQLAFVSPFDVQRSQAVDVHIGLWAQENTKFMGNADPRKLGLRGQARKPIMTEYLRRAALGEHRWCGTLYPTNASAQDAEMSLTEYETFVFEAGLLHLPDPVAAWTAIFESQKQVCDWLNTRKEVRFVAPPRDGHDGTDLRVNVDGSTWINCGGHENFPDGEVFAGPRGVEGHVNYTFPGVYQGREVEGIRLAFKGGRVVDASASKNEAFLLAMLDQDEGARVLGEIAIGTNYAIKQFSKNTLFDEKIGGTFHAACGAGYPESGSDNQSGLHWDMVCDLRQGGSIAADGEVFHRDGKFLRAGWPGN